VIESVRVPLALGFVLGAIGSIIWDRVFPAGAGLRAADPQALLASRA
jgi:hypothetical protein